MTSTEQKVAPTSSDAPAKKLDLVLRKTVHPSTGKTCDTMKEGFARFICQPELKTGKNGDQHLNIGYDDQFDVLPKFEFDVSTAFGISQSKKDDDDQKGKKGKKKAKDEDSESDDEATAAKKKKAKAEKEAKGSSETKEKDKGYQIGWGVDANNWQDVVKLHQSTATRLATENKKILWPDDETKQENPQAYCRPMAKKNKKDAAKAAKYGFSVNASLAPNCICYQEMPPSGKMVRPWLKEVKVTEIEKKPGKYFLQGYYQKLVFKDFYNLKPVVEIVIRRQDRLREKPVLMSAGDYDVYVDEPAVKEEQPKVEGKPDVKVDPKTEGKGDATKDPTTDAVAQGPAQNPIVTVVTTSDSAEGKAAETKSGKRKRDDAADEESAKKDKKRRRKADEDA